MLGLLPVILTFAGAYMLAKLRFFFILHPIAMLKKTARSVKDLDTAKSLALALAGTLGVGNIFGVCLGIIIGGAGSVFWLIISSIFSSVRKERYRKYLPISGAILRRGAVELPLDRASDKKLNLSISLAKVLYHTAFDLSTIFTKLH